MFISLQGVSTMRAAKRTPSAALERHWNEQSVVYLFIFLCSCTASLLTNRMGTLSIVYPKFT